MKLSLASDRGAKPVAHRNSALFWLLSLVVCYQAGHQVYMSFLFLQDDPTAIDPWCSSTSQGSAQQCVEAQLFRGWQSAENEEASDLQEKLDNLLQSSQTSPANSTIASPPTVAHYQQAAPPRSGTAAPPAAAPAVNSSSVAQINQTQSQEQGTTTPPLTPWAKGLISLQENLSERMRRSDAARMKRRSILAHSTMKEWQNMSTLSRDLQALHDHFDNRLAERRANPDSAQQEFTHLTDWARDLQALQKHFESEYHVHGVHTKAQVAESSPPSDNMTSWSRNLSALQQRMEARMEAHKKTHEAIDAMDARLEKHKKAHHALETKKDEPALLEQIAALGREMCSDAAHRQNPKCAQFLAAGSAPHSSTTPPSAWHLRGTKFSSIDEAEAKLKADLHRLATKQQAWEKSFVARVSDTMREFCDDPRHRVQSSCVQFLQEQASHSATDDAAAKKQAWHQKFAAKIANVGHDLCSNPLRREYAICKKILGEQEAAAHSSSEEKLASPSSDSKVSDAPDEAITTTGHAHQSNRIDLHWSTVVDWQTRESNRLRGSTKQPTSADSSAIVDAKTASRLRTYSHWNGAIPSVACITLVPQGSAAKVWIQYFIDNFRLQHYEGGHQLVLVYHHTDHEAAELVHKYSDGSYIKAAVARGDDFPSAAAYRFGAWLARSADVIARWDFQAWHHPHRLSMQVRSLAFSGRPASLLKSWTILDKAGTNKTVGDGQHWDSTIVGEAAWMRANWYPEMAEERAVFDAHDARDMVRLDMPGLEVFDEAVA